ncbi:hypothetical protein KAR48_15035 [bacterium]|nr:hypothetical protein [bacterium]
MMLNPIFHIVGIGFDHDAVYAVELKKRRNRVSVISHAREDIDTTSEHGLPEAIGRLFERYNFGTRHVALHIDPNMERHCTLKAVELQEEETLSWIYKQISRDFVLPVPMDDLIISYQKFDDESGPARLLVGYCKRNSIQSFIESVHSLELMPCLAGSSHVDFHYSRIFDDDFWEGGTLSMALHDNYLRSVLSMNGLPARIRSDLQQSTIDAHLLKQSIIDIKRDLETTAAIQIDKVEVLHDVMLQADADIRSVRPLTGLSDEIPHTHCVAAGLAVRALFPGLDGLDYLPAESRKNTFDSLIKQRVLKGIGIIGGVLLMVYVLLVSIRINAIKANEQSEIQLLEVMDKITEYEHLQKKNDKLYHALASIKTLTQKRSHAARIIEEISIIRSGRLWLEKMDYNQSKIKDGSKKKEKTDLILSGWTFTETDLAMFLLQLEKNSMFKDTQLLRSQSMTSKALKRKLGYAPGFSLIHFSISADMANANR